MTTKTKTQHTPIPWKSEHTRLEIGNTTWDIIPYYSDDKGEAANRQMFIIDLPFAVRAVNSHEKLVEACRQAIYAIPTTHGAFETVRAALKAAGDE